MASVPPSFPRGEFWRSRPGDQDVRERGVRDMRTILSCSSAFKSGDLPAAGSACGTCVEHRDWQMDIAPDDTITCRPSLKTLSRRLARSLQPWALLGSVVLELRVAVAGVAAAGATIAGAGGDRQFAAVRSSGEQTRLLYRSRFRPRNGGSLKWSNARSNSVSSRSVRRAAGARTQVACTR